MITAILAFIHARKWIVELIVAALVVAAIAWWHHSAVEQGMKRVRDEDRAAMLQAKEDADRETSRLKGIADAAETSRAQEQAELDTYRRLDPLHGGLCKPESHRDARVPEARPVDSGHAGSSASAPDLQPVPTRDPEASGRADPDVRHLLDVLAGRADEVSATLREFQAR